VAVHHIFGPFHFRQAPATFDGLGGESCDEGHDMKSPREPVEFTRADNNDRSRSGIVTQKTRLFSAWRIASASVNCSVVIVREGDPVMKPDRPGHHAWGGVDRHSNAVRHLIMPRFWWEFSPSSRPANCILQGLVSSILNPGFDTH
jgi:hypothetical protein